MKSLASTDGSTIARPEKGRSARPLTELLEAALNARRPSLSPDHDQAMRLFNGFYEGYPELVVECFSHSLVLYHYASQPQSGQQDILATIHYYQRMLPWLQAILLKEKQHPKAAAGMGQLVYGGPPATWVREHGVRYALDLQLNHDAGFYLDTRQLRLWLKENMQGKSVLNTFAYTGSLGVAAQAGGAQPVVYLDLSQRYLQIAQASCQLNDLPVRKEDFLAGDYFPLTARMRRDRRTFDCVILDPPLFSSTRRGQVDLLKGEQALINKVRPLINDHGYLVVINNAIFLSGAQFYQQLAALCEDGYLKIEELLPVPLDCTGYPETIQRRPPADPSPFNHPTKIAILSVRRKAPNTES